MHDRYDNPEIKRIFSDENKLNLWQSTELAVIQANAVLKNTAEAWAAFNKIDKIWMGNPINIALWKEYDDKLRHDYNAFLAERLLRLPVELQVFVHPKITSYDGEEPAFARMLKSAVYEVENLYLKAEDELTNLAVKYRFTIMMARTHGQEAELQTFGARCLTWHADLKAAWLFLTLAKGNLEYSKISGAIGKYGSIDPELERTALELLGLKPYYGATQIIPRIWYAPVAAALFGLAAVVNKIALDIRLAARSGRPLMQEPFGKAQTGSSAMPQKKNTIQSEKEKGMERLAIGDLLSLLLNIETWEERAIEQSCVERVAWPDLFHTVCHSLSVIKAVLSGLKVYPDNMLREVRDSRGVYAASEAKEFLKEHLAPLGLGHEDVYRIVQLACFNVFDPSEEWRYVRKFVAYDYGEAASILRRASILPEEEVVSIREFIPRACLFRMDELEISEEQVFLYNNCLLEIFKDRKVLREWEDLFEPEFLLKNEETLYREVLNMSKNFSKTKQ